MNTWLVALDGSYHAEQALGPVLSLLEASDELALLRVVETAESSETALAETYLRELVVRLREGGVDSAIRVLVRRGHPVEEILQAARVHAHQLALCSHGRGGLLRVLLGSVAESILRQAPCPVWLIPARDDPQPYRGECASPLSLERVVVPLDGSPRDERTVSFLRAWPWRRTATLVLLAALDVLIPLSGPPPAPMAKYLELRAGELAAEGWSVESQVSESRPLPALLEQPADLVVMSIHRSDGALAERLGRKAHRPLVFLPHDLPGRSQL